LVDRQRWGTPVTILATGTDMFLCVGAHADGASLIAAEMRGDPSPSAFFTLAAAPALDGALAGCAMIFRCMVRSVAGLGIACSCRRADHRGWTSTGTYGPSKRRRSTAPAAYGRPQDACASLNTLAARKMKRIKGDTPPKLPLTSRCSLISNTACWRFCL